MTDNEVSNNFAAILENVGKGAGVVADKDLASCFAVLWGTLFPVNGPVALIRSVLPEGRRLSECIAVARREVR